MREKFSPSEEIEAQSLETETGTDFASPSENLDSVGERLFEIANSDTNNESSLERARDNIAKMEQHPDSINSDQTLEFITEIEGVKILDPEQRSVLSALREKIVSNAGNLTRKSALAAVLMATEILSFAAAYGQNTNKGEATKDPQKQSLAKDDFNKPEAFPIKIDGNKLTIPTGAKSELLFRENITWPKSVSDLGKMVLEPISIAYNTTYGKDDYYTRYFFGNGDNDFTLEADFPYEYARQFDNATPIEKEAMEQKMRDSAKAMFAELLPQLYGYSFFSTDEFQQKAGELRGNATIKQAEVTGYASGESDNKLDANDPRNLNLSGLRAENAAKVLQKMFQEQNIQVGEIGHKAGGEIHLNQQERVDLLKESHELKIGPNGPEDKQITHLIERYNAGQINHTEAEVVLKQIVGGKRKVAVNIEVGDKSGTIVIPFPLLLGLLLLVGKTFIEDPFSDERTGGKVNELYAHFISRKEDGNEEGSDIETEIDKAINPSFLRKWSVEKVDRKDRIKGFSDEAENSDAVRDAIIENSNHRSSKKRAPKIRAELELNPEATMEDRVGSLGFFVDRYLRMTPTVVNQTRPHSGTITDMVNVYNDPEAMAELLQRIAIPQENQQKVPAFDLSDHRIRFEMSGIKPSQIYGYDKNRRKSVTHCYVSIERYKGVYKIDKDKLAVISDQYREKIKTTE